MIGISLITTMLPATITETIINMIAATTTTTEAMTTKTTTTTISTKPTTIQDAVTKGLITI